MSDDYSGGPTLRGIQKSYKQAARKGNAVPADERSGDVLDGDVYSTRKEFQEQGAAAKGMKQGFAQSQRSNAKEMGAGAAALAKRDTGLAKELKGRGSERLTVQGRRPNPRGGS